jgi:aldehyde:ferredoxin oxidoreductase
MHGFYNRLLRVDLSERTWTAEAISDDVLTCYLNGKGLVAHPLLENAPTVVDPLALENPLILAIGPATGTVLAPTSHYGLFAKSPQAGIFGESYASGHVSSSERVLKVMFTSANQRCKGGKDARLLQPVSAGGPLRADLDRRGDL